MESNFEIFHCILIFNHQQEPILTIYDDFFYNLVIYPNKIRFEEFGNVSINNILMQLFSPIIASQAAMLETMKTKFTSIDLYSDHTIVLQKLYNCSLIILLSDKCPFRRHNFIINKKLELIEWLICSFYGICWSQMKLNSENWMRILLQEMWLMDKTEFNLTFWSIERIDLSSQLKLNEQILDVLLSNSRYLRQINERRLRHQLILVGSKLFSLHTTTESNSLKTKDILLFVLISNAVFNRFSRARESVALENTLKNDTQPNKKLVRSISVNNKEKDGSINSSSSNEESSLSDFPEAENTLTNIKLTDSLKTNSVDRSSSLSSRDYDPFVIWIENKDGHKYRIVRIFLPNPNGVLMQCYLHLIKLARNVIYLGVEEDFDIPFPISILDKSIRSLRKMLLDYERNHDLVLRNQISPAVDKLHYAGTFNSQQLRTALRLVVNRSSNSPEILERLLKELLKVFEHIYCHIYISSPIVINEKLCKSFLRCFLSIKKEMSDYLSILSIKALRNMSPTSFYPLYPGMVHFIVKTGKLHSSLICPVIDKDFLSELKIQRLHILLELCQKIASLSSSWRHIEVCDSYFRCTFLKRKYKVLEDKVDDFELTVFHLPEVSYSIVKKQINLLTKQFLSDQRDDLDLMT